MFCCPEVILLVLPVCMLTSKSVVRKKLSLESWPCGKTSRVFGFRVVISIPIFLKPTLARDILATPRLARGVALSSTLGATRLMGLQGEGASSLPTSLVFMMRLLRSMRPSSVMFLVNFMRRTV